MQKTRMIRGKSNRPKYSGHSHNIDYVNKETECNSLQQLTENSNSALKVGGFRVKFINFIVRFKAFIDFAFITFLVLFGLSFAAVPSTEPEGMFLYRSDFMNAATWYFGGISLLVLITLMAGAYYEIYKKGFHFHDPLHENYTIVKKGD